MASSAQILANRANARRSTGPSSQAGKTRASKNATTHGLTTGYLVVTPEEREPFAQFEAALAASVLPQGAVELETCRQLCESAWRLRKLHTLHLQLAGSAQLDPLVNPESAAACKQLARYRAAVEMSFYRSLKLLRDLQTRRAARELHLHEPVRDAFPQHVEPGVYGKSDLTYGDRDQRLSVMGYIGPFAIWKPVLDAQYRFSWVLKPKSEWIDPCDSGFQPPLE